MGLGSVGVVVAAQCSICVPMYLTDCLVSIKNKDNILSVLVACLTSQQHASVSQVRVCSAMLTCCRIETEVADQTFYLTPSQYTDTGLTIPSADPIMPGAWQGQPLECQFLGQWYDSTRKNPHCARGIRTSGLPLSRRIP